MTPNKSFKAYAAQSPTVQTIKSNWKLRRVNVGMAVASLLFVGISAACTSGGGWTDLEKEAFQNGMQSESSVTIDQTTLDCATDFAEDKWPNPEEILGYQPTLADAFALLEACPTLAYYGSE